jgi:hypothetical protein
MTTIPTTISKKEAHLPDTFRHIRLELAREPGNPEGRTDFGYLLWVPLNAEGKIDDVCWKDYRDHYRVLKFRPGQPNQIGHVTHSRSGWKLHYDIAGKDPDEAGFHFEDERFVPGEYVSIRDGEKHTHVYKVSTVERY